MSNADVSQDSSGLNSSHTETRSLTTTSGFVPLDVLMPDATPEAVNDSPPTSQPESTQSTTPPAIGED